MKVFAVITAGVLSLAVIAGLGMATFALGAHTSSLQPVSQASTGSTRYLQPAVGADVLQPTVSSQSLQPTVNPQQQ